MSFSSYGSYKDTNVAELGEVPAHWNVVPLKHVVETPVTDGPHETPEFIDDGIPFVSAEAVSSGEINFSKSRFISHADHHRYSKKYKPRRNDIFMVKSGATTGVVALVSTDRDFNIWSPLAVVRCSRLAFPRYVLQAMRSRNFQESVILNWSFGTQQNIGMSVIENLRIPLPPKPEQTQIARFLDHETARIDALIEEQQRLIELLKEKRQAVISQAVTKGLVPTVPMKDSGVEWLGELPAHWELTAVKYVVQDMSQGWSPQCDNYPAEDGEWGVLKVGCVNGGMFNPAENKRLPDELEPDAGLAIKQGDLLISRANTRELVGSAAVAVSDYPWLMLCDKLYRLRLNAERVAPEFLALYLGSSAPRSQIELAASGASDSMQNISQSVVLEMSLTLPPLSEQKIILQCLGDTLKISDELVAEVTNQRCLLQERRSALISAAVTGKIDVRGWQPPASAPTPELVQEAM